jgi:predicted nucleic-acid-binding Zn-ribbon protein
MNDALPCPKCNGRMRLGFLAERGQQSTYVAQWIDGEPVNPELCGRKGVNVDVRNRNAFPVRSIRCDQCGFLELYAV